MKASNWEFRNRATVFGLIFGFTFPLYVLDPQNSTVALANWLGAGRQIDTDLVARLLFAFAAFLLVLAALIRTWASSYLQASVVYASEVNSESLVADGPYRRVRNPLYFANVLMIIAMGAMMSRLGFFVGVVAMLGLLLQADPARGGRTSVYPGSTLRRLLQSGAAFVALPVAAHCLRRTPTHVGEGIKAEGWYWGFAAALI